jgi:hypothetical protein
MNCHKIVEAHFVHSLIASRLAGDDNHSDGWFGARFFHL